MLKILGFRRSWVHIAALASAGAAAIHFAAARPHLMEWAPAGGFMVASGLAQLVWAIWLMAAPSDEAVVAGVALNSGIVALWVISRTAGLPFGPEAGNAEHIHAADALATALEIVVIRAALRVHSEVAPPRVLGRLTAAAVALVLLAGDHEPAREGLTAAAALGLALVARALIASVVPLMKGRRNHVATIVRRAAVHLGGADRPNLGACEPGAS